MKILKITALLFVVLCLANCKKDKDDTTPPTAMERLTAGDGRWYQEHSSFATYTECEKHGSLRLFANGNFILEEYSDTGGTCAVNVTRSGTWMLISDTEMSLALGASTMIYTINTVTATELAVQFTIGEDVFTGSFDKTPGNG
ncbi:hypothetical protein [Niabella hirudinis]|uniref:hypothetical protein n=1 Tax=Niabella hirudinis TaxID=1285929 RepID=UPI003EBDC54E